MSGHSAESGGILVVDVTRDGLPPPDPAWRGSPLEPDRQAEAGLLHAEGIKDLGVGEAVEGGPGDRLDHQAQQHGVEVAVLGGVAGGADQWLRVEQGDHARAASAGAPVDRHVVLEAAGVVQQHAHGHLILEPAREAGQVTPDPGVEVELALIHQAHRRARRGDDLGDGGDVPERRVGVGDLGRGIPGEMAVAAGVEDRVPPADDDDRAGIEALADPGLGGLVHLGERLCGGGHCRDRHEDGGHHSAPRRGGHSRSHQLSARRARRAPGREAAGRVPR